MMDLFSCSNPFCLHFLHLCFFFSLSFLASLHWPWRASYWTQEIHLINLFLALQIMRGSLTSVCMLTFWGFVLSGTWALPISSWNLQNSDYSSCSYDHFISALEKNHRVNTWWFFGLLSRGTFKGSMQKRIHSRTLGDYGNPELSDVSWNKMLTAIDIKDKRMSIKLETHLISQSIHSN